MLCKDVIKLMEKLIEDNKPHEAIMGEAEVMIDIFKLNDDGLTFSYQGISPEVRITVTADGVYSVLTAFTKDEEDIRSDDGKI